MRILIMEHLTNGFFNWSKMYFLCRHYIVLTPRKFLFKSTVPSRFSEPSQNIKTHPFCLVSNFITFQWDCVDLSKILDSYTSHRYCSFLVKPLLSKIKCLRIHYHSLCVSINRSAALKGSSSKIARDPVLGTSSLVTVDVVLESINIIKSSLSSIDSS